jgi:DNA end-binding protein Ku
MKSVWNGSISFGLVSIDVHVYSAVQEHLLGFKLLCKKCHTPIHYERWCNHCNKEVSWNDTVKGLKLTDGSYFIVTQATLHELKPVKTETIDIHECIDSAQLKLIYLERHYYVAPSKIGEKPYFLFKKALENSHKVAIGTFVMRDKEYACAITPYENGLLLTTLNYDYEIRKMSAIAELKTIPKIQPQELKLAQQLIDQLATKTFVLSRYKDTFAQELKKAIKKQSKKSKPARKEKKVEKPKRSKEKDLTAKLRASLQAPARSERPAARARKRK